jgi:GH15 family glucan-1,4-alpha-glucosidase
VPTLRPMPLPIEDYALIGDTQAAALVGRDGSIDWLCLPRFDSDACFAALLGDEGNGRWLLAPDLPVRAVRRRYRPGTLVLETEFVTDAGTAVVSDCMPPRGRDPDLLREVRVRHGRVPMRLELRVRFGYGATVPWVLGSGRRVVFLAGPDCLTLYLDPAWEIVGDQLVSRFAVGEGERATFLLRWHPSHEPEPPMGNPSRAIEEAESWWCEWSGRFRDAGPYGEAVLRSLLTLKALTYSPTGGLVAAPTTSLPEQLGGVRNWDYRFCWLRDATFTIDALVDAGFLDEARAFRDWLLRAVAGDPSQLQIVYGLSGERRLFEVELPWLSGYEASRPVRLGNRAMEQVQLDVFGEVMDSFHEARLAGIDPEPHAWNVQRAFLEFLEAHWHRPDHGIWEVRGPPRDFTHSKVMAWVAVDRAIRSVERLGLDGPVERWRGLREEIHREVCRRAWDEELGSFTQSYGSGTVDAALLLLPLVGFLPADDPRIRGTVAAVRRELTVDGLLLRYRTHPDVDGLPPGEGAFLACSFWLCDVLSVSGEMDQARALFERLLGLANDVGLLAESYDPIRRRQVGNFPQAFSHVALVSAARLLQREACRARARACPIRPAG